MLKNLIEKSFYQNRELNQLTFTRLKKYYKWIINFKKKI